MEEPVPKGVSFCVSDTELLEEFLRPYVNHVEIEGNMLLTKDIYTHAPYDLPLEFNKYFPPMTYWYFVPRIHLRNNRPNRAIRNQPNEGKWTYYSTKKIRRGAEILGHKETLDFKTNQGITTGWRQHELRLEANVFQTTVLVQLFYDITRDLREQGQAQIVDVLAAENGGRGEQGQPEIVDVPAAENGGRGEQGQAQIVDVLAAGNGGRGEQGQPEIVDLPAAGNGGRGEQGQPEIADAAPENAGRRGCWSWWGICICGRTI